MLRKSKTVIVPILAILFLLSTALIWTLLNYNQGIEQVTSISHSFEASQSSELDLATSSGRKDDADSIADVSQTSEETSTSTQPNSATLTSLSNYAEPSSPDPSTDDEPENTEPDTPRLSPHVFRVIDEVQQRQLDGQWEEALNEMNALYAEFDDLTPYEQMFLLNFYTNTLLQLEMWQEAISAFSMLLEVPELGPDTSARALLSLGQLHSRFGEPELAVLYLESWLDQALDTGADDDRLQNARQLLADAKIELSIQ